MIWTLQRKLELEYYPPKEESANEGGPVLNLEREPTIPQFPLLEKKEDKGKKKEHAGTSHQEDSREELQELSLPDLLPPLPEVRKPNQLIKLGASNSSEGTSTKGLLVDFFSLIHQEKLSRGIDHGLKWGNSSSS